MKSWSRPLPALVATLAVLAAAGAAAQARDDRRWFLSTDLQGLVGGFSGSTARDSLVNVGAFVRGDYLERGGFTLGYNRTALAFDDGAEDIEQRSLFLSGRIGLTPDALDGRLTLRLDVHDVANVGPMSTAGEAQAVAAQISYINFARTFYWDIGVAETEYPGAGATGGRLKVEQWTPTLGVGFNRQRDWLQLRGYLIDLGAQGVAGAPGDTSALELKWTHWPVRKRSGGLKDIRASILGGERLFAVDHDAAAVYNLAELQAGAASVGAEWAIGERTGALLILGVEQYEALDTRARYRSPFVYLNFSHTWD
jgi:hypothetical protein